MAAAGLAGGGARGNVRAVHFAERHGLCVILVPGETLIAVGAVVSDARWTGTLIGLTLLGVTSTHGLWWMYFPQGHPLVEQEMRMRSDSESTAIVRDAFSLLHFPTVCDVIACAVAVEEAARQPVIDVLKA